MKPVAAGDEVAFERLGHAILLVSDLRRAAGQAMQLDVFRLFDDAAAVAFPDPVQFLGDRRLAVRPHRPAGMLPRIDRERLAVLPRDPRAVMRMAFAVHPFPDAGVAQQLDRAVFEHAGPNALEHVRLGLPLEHDAVDSAKMQHMGQEEAGGPPADDRDLSAGHAFRSLPDRAPAQPAGRAPHPTP